MASDDWDFLIWHRANDLLQQAGRIQSNILQIAPVPIIGHLMAGNLPSTLSRLTKASG
jgi:hypothetical protein